MIRLTMTEPIAYQSVPPALPFADKRPQLLAAGILLILSGIMAGCSTLMMPLALVIPQQPGQPKMTLSASHIVAAMLLYGAIAGALIWLGIGAVRKRRWSRPLILILATHWIILGAVSLVASIVMFPVTRDTLADIPNFPREFLGWMLAVGIAVSAVFMVGLPTLIFWLTRSEAADQTLRHFDPVERWTDRCPLKILGLSMTLYLAAALFGFSATYMMFPIGGVLLKGMPAIVVSLAIAGVLALSGYRVYRCQLRGWWLGLAGIVVPALLMIPSMLRVPLADIYRSFGTPEEQIAAIVEHAGLIRATSISFLILLAISFTIYMVRLLPPLRAASQSTQS